MAPVRAAGKSDIPNGNISARARSNPLKPGANLVTCASKKPCTYPALLFQTLFSSGTNSYHRHRHGSIGHGGDHIAPAFVSPSLVLPVENGRLVLGTWQSVVLVDPNR